MDADQEKRNGYGLDGFDEQQRLQRERSAGEAVAQGLEQRGVHRSSSSHEGWDKGWDSLPRRTSA